LLSQLASKSVKVVLTGEGADEVFGGYPWFRTDKLLRPLRKLPRGIRRFIARVPAIRKRWPRASRILSAPTEMNLARYKHVIDSGNPEFDDCFFSDDVRQKLINDRDMDDGLGLPNDFEKWHPFAQLQYLEIKVRLPDYITRHLDASSMAFSLEARVPFLDHELVELCAQIPPSLKMRGLEEKHILRLALRDDLPLEIRRRKKRGLAAPYDQWIRDLPEFAMELLSEGQLREKGYFNHKVVSHMLEQHRAGNAEHGLPLMGVLGVQLWDDLFVRGCRPKGEGSVEGGGS
jgi:asparagine synthase (glutamine-hydrolysing)